MWKYVEIKSLKEAKKNETVCVYYPNPWDNISGKKSEECIKKAAKDAKAGKCKLLIWRECENEALNQLIQQVNKEKAIRIVHLFEELLDKKGIEIPCNDPKEQEQRHEGGNDAKLYGMEYYNLVDTVQELL